ncbi:hypothetical protein LJY25_17590 [Hymenobacter sp. BT175]|uniref:hypothetical protein n=1 Tax=Hymenobacter translucens TaxID=2886507 RepID=UPI001D0E4A58|nr:hypothetical protein [Hymenobacter translucens]MCC2548267.1 hypothetical protein [Hymenobacter translucens]
MATETNHTTSGQEPHGDLERLFREKFAEAEITPRAHLWDQLDHELLVRQNEAYRRRLVEHRWVAAASAAVLLSVGSWLGLRESATTKGASAELAATVAPGSPAARGAATATTSDRSATAAASGMPLRADGAVSAGTQAAGAQSSSSTYASVASSPETVAPVGRREAGQSASRAAVVAYSSQPAASGASSVSGAYVAGSAAQGLTSAAVPTLAAGGSSASAAGTLASRGTGAGNLPDGETSLGGDTKVSFVAGSDDNTNSGSLSRTTFDALPGRESGLGLLAGLGLPDSLKRALPQGPELLAQQNPGTEEDAKASLSKAGRLRWSAAYSAAAFNPNIDFSQPAASAVAMSPRGGVATTAMHSGGVAANEYRANLRPGLGQRLALTVKYALTDRWALGGGLQVADQRASSASSHFFLDDRDTRYVQSNYSLSVVHTTNYRYRTAGLPLSLSYESQGRKGLSFYAKMGAAVDVLLGSRSEIEGVPESQRNYLLTSPDSPYRKVLASLNGGAGLRYQPARAAWTVALGPELEGGLTTLNANPSQELWRQTRPYSVGLAASVEFGPKAAAVR